MTRLLIIGIDSVDAVLLDRFQADLPTWSKLKKECPRIKFTGVNPPDSPTSWASIFTGLNPAKHGVLEFIDPLEKTTMSVTKEIANETIRGRTFWDFAGNPGGKKVCVILPPLGFPVWPVNGMMVARASSSDAAAIYPPEAAYLIDGRDLTNLKGVIGRSPQTFIDMGRSLVQRELEFSLEMMKSQDWDLFYTYSSVLDPMQHGFWSDFDEQDPAHNPESPYKNVIEEFYQLFDDVVAQYLAHVDEDVAVVVLSDHGHCMRPVELLNINELLRRQGHLVMRSGSGKVLVQALEKVKRKILDLVVRFGLGNVAIRVMRTIPGSKSIYTKPANIDFDKTVAYLSDLSGIKSYSYGGIRVEREKIADEGRYEEIRSEIISALQDIEDQATNEKYMKWICRREDLYEGEYQSRYPEIVFRLNDQYGAGWEIDGKIHSLSRSHNIQPGSHNEQTPVIFFRNLSGFEVTRHAMTLMDVAPTILQILGLEDNVAEFDGSSIFSPLAGKQGRS